MPCLIPSDRLVISTVTHTAPMLLGGIGVNTDGTNAAIVTVYDSENENVSGKKIVWSNTDAGANNYGGLIFPHPIKMERGCYVSVSGTGAKFWVYEFKQ